MKKILTTLSLAAALFGATTEAHAHDKYQSRTRGNNASFSTWTSDGCSSTSFYLTAYQEEQRQQSSRTDYNGAYVDYYSYDYCTGENSWGWGVLTASSFAAQRLNSASLQASGSIEIYRCSYDGGMGGGGSGGSGGGSAGMGGTGGGSDEDGGVYEDPCTYANVPLEIDFDWTGTGDTLRDNSSYTYSSPHSRYRSRSNGTSREATVSGSVTVDGMPIDLSSGWGNLSQLTSGYFEMWH